MTTELRQTDKQRPRADQSAGTIPPPSRYAPWRAACLGLVYVLFAAHITHWLVAGKTLAPLELNEVMYTFELGIVTAGFLFMAVALLATAIFGRFFCSWGCHILALQDLCSWLLRKLHIRPKPVRSRLLLWVPVVAVLYMFVWPQVSRISRGDPLPTWRLATDAEGWASFVTENFWRNLPGPGVIILTFAICGFVIVYVLGSRSFCQYGCPYGAVFQLADRVAPGKIRIGDDCVQCGTCTSVCTSHVRVHEELNRFGMVVNPACMKDLDCVSACPQQSLHYGFGRPSIFKRVIGNVTVRKHYDLAIWEELLLGAFFVIFLAVFRGLYDLVPFLMSLGLAAILSCLLVLSLRLVRHPGVTFGHWVLKGDGRLKPAGRLFVGGVAAVVAFTSHSAWIRYHSLQGVRYYHFAAASNPADGPAAQRAVHHLGLVHRWGLLPVDRIDRALGDVYSRLGRWQDAEPIHRQLVNRRPNDPFAHDALARTFMEQGRLDEATQQYQASLTADPQRADTHYAIAGVYFRRARPLESRRHLLEAVRLQPGFADAHYDLGALLVRSGEVDAGVAHLRRAVEIRPDFADAHFNLAVALAMLGRLDEARTEADKAYDLNPGDDRTVALRQRLEAAYKGPDAGQ